MTKGHISFKGIRIKKKQNLDSFLSKRGIEYRKTKHIRIKQFAGGR